MVTQMLIAEPIYRETCSTYSFSCQLYHAYINIENV